MLASISNEPYLTTTDYLPTRLSVVGFAVTESRRWLGEGNPLFRLSDLRRVDYLYKIFNVHRRTLPKPHQMSNVFFVFFRLPRFSNLVVKLQQLREKNVDYRKSCAIILE